MLFRSSAAFSLQSLPAARSSQTGSIPDEVGKRAAEELIARGAGAILAEFQKSFDAVMTGEQ